MNESLTVTSNPDAAPRLAVARARCTQRFGGLRSAEKLTLFYLGYLALESMVFPVEFAGRLVIGILNVISGAVVIALSRFGQASPPVHEDGTSTRAGSVHGLSRQYRALQTPKSELLQTLRNCFPALLILLAYRESGTFYLPDPAHRLDYFFVRLDHLVFQSRFAVAVLTAGAPWLQHYLEFCYMLCYPMVPLGVAAIYLLRRFTSLRAVEHFDFERAIDQFWSTVLLALFTCYALAPFFPSTPARAQ